MSIAFFVAPLRARALLINWSGWSEFNLKA
jgi:hypothetical protein